ncbi:MAG: TIGR02757 family protein [Elusimicrobia bacterium]|nr:TIGR02757 family protein [Elusimicrobiota bacterium]
MSRAGRLRDALEALRAQTDFAARVKEDPVSFPRRFEDPADREIAAWLAASLAYGRVALFSAALERVLEAMGGKPRAFVERFEPKRDLALFEPLYYRMNSGRDIACLLFLMRHAVRRHETVGAMFRAGWRDSDADIGPALDRFVAELDAVDVSAVYGRNARPRGLAQLFSRPSKGSACKRLNMLLRWMVRPDDGVDLGLWTFVPPSKLIVPLDTHVLRIARYLGLTRRRTGGWRTAQAVTRRLAEAAPDDPLRYDFPICHHGISGRCPVGRAAALCRACPLLGECAKGRALTRAVTAE